MPESNLPRTSMFGAMSKANTTNPKDLVGNAKVSYSKVPAIAVAHCAMAMMDGAAKYGPFNWRDKEVIASIYIDAAKRHLDCWFEGQKAASDSKVHHLGHAMACCAILLDAEAKGKLVDDRPLDEADLDFMEKQLAAMSETIKQKRAEAEQKKAMYQSKQAGLGMTNGQLTQQPYSLTNSAATEPLGTCLGEEDSSAKLPHPKTEYCTNWRPL
jgi:hypothetical protein